MARYAERVLHRVRISLSAGGPTVNQMIQFPPVHGGDTQGGRTHSAESWLLLRTHFVRSSGSSANYRLRMGNATGFVAGSINEFLTGALTPVATVTNDAYAQPIPFRADANNRAYLRVEWDGGFADNVAEVEVWFERAQGGGG